MHFDEARVGYWTLRYGATGRFAYRPIIHGPFLPLSTRPVLDLLGPTDFAVRLVPAVLGGVLPAAALLFRDQLTDAETTTVAGLLALNPLLLYFSRFFRADIPLAAFGFVAFGLLARSLRMGRRRDLLAAGVAVGFALTTKENVLVYIACWLGAAVVVFFLDVFPRFRRGTASEAIRTRWQWSLSRLRRLIPAVPAATGLGILIAWWFYVPRGYSPGLGDVAARPLATLAAGTLGAWNTFAASIWASGSEGAYLPLFVHLAGTIALAGPVVYAAAVIGLRTELDRSNPRSVVVASAAWGFVSLFGYPLAADIKAPWLAVHVLVPLVIPAAVGCIATVNQLVLWWRVSDPKGLQWVGPRVRTVAVCVVIILLLVQTGGVALVTSYTSPPPRVNFIAQGAQPGDDLDPLVEDLYAARGRGGMLYYGDRFRLPANASTDLPPRRNPAWLGFWLRRLPLPWYVERGGIRHAWAGSPRELPANLPPVIVASDEAADELIATGRVDGYERRSYDLGLFGNTVIVFTDLTVDSPANDTSVADPRLSSYPMPTRLRELTPNF